ncbi:MAG: hypothetical protein PUB80_00165 [Clostridiales bacterium]|nr:hypothetical protein [Clostridiales bacterium]
MTYKLCKRLAAMGKLTADMLDVYFAAGRISAEEYAELIALVA